MKADMENTWSASSTDCVADENNDLSELAGVWSSQVHVSITNLATINYGFAKIHLTDNQASGCFPSEAESD